MKNITSTWRAISMLAHDRGESMASVPVEGVDCLVRHLRELDRVFIAAESFVACASSTTHRAPWSEDEIEGLTYLREAVREVTQ